MRVIAIFSVVVSMLLGPGCNKDIDPDSPFFLSWHNCSQRNYGNGTVKICFDELMQDSRCPIGAMCIWQGVAELRFSFTVNDSRQDITLATLNIPGMYRSDTTLMGYKVELLSVTPYPQINVSRNISDYRAELKITRQ
jgi:hypothetical protein